MARPYIMSAKAGTSKMKYIQMANANNKSSLF